VAPSPAASAASPPSLRQELASPAPKPPSPAADDSDEYEDDIEEESIAESAESDFEFDDAENLGESSSGEGYTFD